MTEPWIVLLEEHRRRFGGDLRRAYILRALADRTAARTAGWTPALAGPLLRSVRGGLLPWRRREPPFLASVEALEPEVLELARARTHLIALDVHDDPVLQLEALGVVPAAARHQELVDRARRNRDAFPMLLAPTASFAELAGLPSERTIVSPNGTDTTHVRPVEAWPASPTIGFASGAAPNRGIETLVEAARRVRAELPDMRLLLWLVATGADSSSYLERLTAELRGESWIEVGTAPYERLGAELSRATVLAVPHPPAAYLDVALPVKLLDAMASGRPVAITPRIESARVVREADAGIVAGGDTADDLAAALLALLNDEGLARRLGANGRRAAERDFDWAVIGARVADRVLVAVG
jgi:glycosyltransferase involved in cell wall biosynthesis